jgi:hypothetical protein
MRTFGHIMLALLAGGGALVAAVIGTSLTYTLVYQVGAFVPTVERYLAPAVLIGLSIDAIAPVLGFIFVFNRLHNKQWLPRKLKQRIS